MSSRSNRWAYMARGTLCFVTALFVTGCIESVFDDAAESQISSTTQAISNYDCSCPSGYSRCYAIERDTKILGGWLFSVAPDHTATMCIPYGEDPSRPSSFTIWEDKWAGDGYTAADVRAGNFQLKDDLGCVSDASLWAARDHADNYMDDRCDGVRWVGGQNTGTFVHCDYSLCTDGDNESPGCQCSYGILDGCFCWAWTDRFRSRLSSAELICNRDGEPGVAEEDREVSSDMGYWDCRTETKWTSVTSEVFGQTTTKYTLITWEVCTYMEV